ncbi:MAG: hypothetical protein GXP39_01090 [Chloroflexi bacterium]|nr:hypothetical protein [Chloroflexota bacterium]
MNPEIHFTLGPTSWPPTTLRAVLEAGAHTCRVNLSHMQPDQLEAWFAHVRGVAAEIGKSIRIGADVRGRKLRIGPLPDGRITLTVGQTFTLIPVGTSEEAPGGDGHASVNCPALGEIARPGDLILLDDGALRLRVKAAQNGSVECIVEIGGSLPERSGVNLPGRRITLPSLTAKDRQDLDALAPLRPDCVYLSYVETAADIALLRHELAQRGLHVPIIAKIERAVALAHIEEIAAAADALCLARGDLGVEVPLPQIPRVQRQVAQAAREAQTPVLLAGEVLYSMIDRHIPYRAEVTDVAVALEQGYAGFILSDETAMGCDPPGAVRWIQRIASAAISDT